MKERNNPVLELLEGTVARSRSSLGHGVGLENRRTLLMKECNRGDD
jgi:hypothetical protein